MLGIRGIGHKTLILLAALTATPLFAGADLQYGNDQNAKQDLSKKILNLLETNTFAVGQYSQKKDQTDRNSMNPFGADTTYHSYTWSYCMEWVTVQTCKRWLDPYATLHGVKGGGEQSKLENAMGEIWKSLKKDVSDGQDGQYAMWNVKAREGKSILRKSDPVRQNTLDPESLADWRLVKQAEDKSKEIGDESGKTAIRGMVEAAPGEENQTMPNMVKLRAGGAASIRELRNRLVSDVGEARASQPGIEFELGEDRPTCEAYLQNYKNYEDKARTEGSIPLPLRDFKTFANQDVKKRYELCKQVTGASIYQINPEAKGAEVSLGDPNNERYDAAVARVNVALIDQVGLDPSTQPLPEGVTIPKDDLTQQIANYMPGGAEYFETNETNKLSLAKYKNSLQQGAVNWKAAEERAPEIGDATKRILAGIIEPGTKRADQITGLTDQMKEELAGTEVANSPIYKTSGVRTEDPNDESLELKPSQLTITTLGNGGGDI